MPTSTPSTTSFNKTQWNQWLDQLAEKEYIYIDSFIDDSLYQKIQHYFHTLYSESEFTKAAIGPSKQQQIKSSIRGDFIYWLDREKDSEISALFVLLEELVDNLKQNLFLSIADYEFHFALYPAETFYKKHLDQFQGQSNRLISVLIYLNDHWQPGDGGELKIYEPNGKEVLIEPLGNRLLMFKSDSVAHEVLLTHKSRKSLTGWLLQKPASLNHLV
ncbi:2OG-Fe(II) oxygenase [Fodinibius salsisoli]|uniref:2OG-Fe(II) oxygenase n=1 Tax=Fodinibius salsisoli TaxID=2820877 RepID=A0ABT3PIZ6_9BACT|nr:2OG-Fe(II) oxygenase [Fodinibius salsisoli]MCW9705920.1 2OG-Fe(II) oxygenase [Fodinibius salsisoli]